MLGIVIQLDIVVLLEAELRPSGVYSLAHRPPLVINITILLVFVFVYGSLTTSVCHRSGRTVEYSCVLVSQNSGLRSVTLAMLLCRPLDRPSRPHNAGSADSSQSKSPLHNFGLFKGISTDKKTKGMLMCTTHDPSILTMET